MAVDAAEQTDVVVVGNGPSALILSYILHGNVPFYSGQHPDALLHKRLASQSNLLDVAPDIYQTLQSSVKYTNQALPANTLLDTLIRPYGDVGGASEGCVGWRHESKRAVPHLLLGEAPRAGGQWADNPVAASWEIGTLSYAEQLSLPGWSIEEFWQARYAVAMPDLERPTRRQLAEYFAQYPRAVGIADVLRTSTKVSGVSRTAQGFYISSHNLHCKHIVLASGIFSINLSPPRFLSPLTMLNSEDGPVLVIGSGFTAADIIISTPPHRKIIHIFNWDPEHRPSPLRACHRQAYPEYAFIYQQMKIVGTRFEHRGEPHRAPQKAPKPLSPAQSNLTSFVKRDWAATYEGFANARVIAILPHDAHETASVHHSNLFSARRRSLFDAHEAGSATVQIGRSATGEAVQRSIASFRYATGRRGSLAYLAPALLAEVLLAPPRAPRRRSSSDASAAALQSRQSLAVDEPVDHRRLSAEHDFALDIGAADAIVSGRALRESIEDAHFDLPPAGVDGGPQWRRRTPFEVAPGVFAVGSLTGDSLVRFAYGACCAVGGAIMGESLRPSDLADALESEPAVGGDLYAAESSAADSSMLTELNGSLRANGQEPVRQRDADRERRRKSRCIVS